MDDPLAPLTAAPDEATRALNEMLDGALAGAPATATIPIEIQRQQAVENFSKIGAPAPVGEERVIPGPAGDIPVRIYVPAGDVRGVYLYIHGGSWMLGRHDCFDGVLWPRANDSNVAVVSVGYRLAPENAWPACADDCEAAAVWLAEKGPAEFGTDRFVIGGESAGAHLSAVTLLRLRDRHGITSYRGAELRYGMYDMRLTPSMRHWPGPFLDRPTVEWSAGLLVPDDHPRDDPDLSPLLADLAGMPPALFTCGTRDGLLDDTLFLWSRWRAAGNQADLRLHPGCVHAFDLMPLPAAKQANADIAGFITACVA